MGDRGFGNKRRTRRRRGTGCGRLGRKTHELSRSRVDECGGNGTEVVEMNIKMIEDHTKEHPIRERAWRVSKREL